MFRPMASGVSALSGLVANGHRIMHSVSSSLSKIPYGGFSPVRLQTEFSSRNLRRRAHTRRLISGQRHRRCAPVALAGKLPQAAVGGVSASVLRSRGPWLASGLCCPAGSSLTMPSSEPLAPSTGLFSSSRGDFRAPEGPNFYLPVLSSVPPALPRRIDRPGLLVTRSH